MYFFGNPEAEPIKIVSPEIQMKCFAAIILKMPHISSRFSGKLQEEISKKIFVKDHRPIMYYTAALLNYHMERAFNNDEIDQIYNKFKYHMQTIIAHFVWKDKIRPQMNSNKMDEYCELLISSIEEHSFG